MGIGWAVAVLLRPRPVLRDVARRELRRKGDEALLGLRLREEMKKLFPIGSTTKSSISASTSFPLSLSIFLSRPSAWACLRSASSARCISTVEKWSAWRNAVLADVDFLSK